MPTSKFMLGFGCFIVAHILAWFQLNSQFVWEWWQNKPLVSVCIFSIPMGLCFWYGTKFLVADTGELWSSRLVAFAASYLIFPFLTWWLAHESPFTTKTLICIFLSCLIVAVQLFWK